MIQGKNNLNFVRHVSQENNSFSFITSYKELAEQCSCTCKSISKAVRSLEARGFIKLQNIYIRKTFSNNDDAIRSEYYADNNNGGQERQDKSLWKITLSLPDNYILALENCKNHSTIISTDIKVTASGKINRPNEIEDCLVLGGVKFSLNSQQSRLFKSLIGSNLANVEFTNGFSRYSSNNIATAPDTAEETNINSIMEQLDSKGNESKHDKLERSTSFENKSYLPSNSNDITYSASSNIEALDIEEKKSNGLKSAPHVAKSGLLLNKDLKIKIENIKSNLWGKSKVLFNNFLQEFCNNGNSNLATYAKANTSGKFSNSNRQGAGKSQGKAKPKEFNIHSELIREKLKLLPKDKADKARKFAYTRVSKGMDCGYASSFTKNELAKELIVHAASWKPTKLGAITSEHEIDTALLVAWKAVVSGKWQAPLELAKAQVLEYEYRHHRHKYQESGIIALELKTIEIDTRKATR